MKKITAPKTEKYVTETVFERNMASIANSFAHAEELSKKRFDRHESLLERMLKQIEMLREDNQYIRKSVQSFIHDVSIHDRKIEDINERVEKLEKKPTKAS